MERPILMNSEMVQATLDGRKTQTRRIVKFPDDWEPLTYKEKESDYLYTFLFDAPCGRYDGGIKCNFGKPGDELWVRETFWIDHIDYFQGGKLPKEKPQCLIDNPELLMYKAEGSCCSQLIECACSEIGKPKMRPSIHMPRWASRIKLLIKDIRVERVQDITWQDCRAEGIKYITEPGEPNNFIDSFRVLWGSINEKRGFGWDINPWVWVVEFERIK